MDTAATGLFPRIWALYEDGGLLPMCAWCGRMRLDGDWHFPPRGILAAIDEPGAISHSICEQCAVEVTGGTIDATYTLHAASQ